MKFIATILMMTAAFAAEKTAFDKATLEAYLRHVELWRPDVEVKIDEPKDSKELPGFLDISVHLTFNKMALPEQHFFVSKDGKKVFRADVYDINKNPFQANIDKLDVKGAPSLGPANAPVTLVIFSDFQCPLCKQEAEVIHKQLPAAFPTQVRVYFRDFPLETLHNWARPAAIAGRCVYKMNPAAFWDFHDWIYDNQTYIGLDNINSKLQEFATAKGLDNMQFSRCLESKSTEPELNASIAVGNSLQLNATPTIFLNGRKLEGAVPWETLQTLINMEIDHVSKSAAPAKTEECCTVNIPKIVKKNRPRMNTATSANSGAGPRPARRLSSRRDFILISTVLIPLASLAADISPDLYVSHIRYLASPELKGRATGSPELEKAARYIADQFRSFGLQPSELAFPVALGAHLGTKNKLKFKDSAESRNLASGKDFLPISFSSSGEFRGAVVFAGYGVTDKKENYDDYDGLDVTGKFVLILRHEPKENPHKEHVTFADKAVNAKMHGARGVILINDTDHHEGADDLGKFSETTGPKNAGVLFVRIKSGVAEAWLKSDSHDLHAIAKQIDQDGHPHSFPLSNVSVDLSVDVRFETKTVHNVAAYLPGETDEYVVVGAHYDHLGLGDEHSLAPSQIGTVHPGADDNASGTAGVIELARWASHQPKPKRGILFLTFAGEELGLLGSEWYVNHPAYPLEKAVAMINMDMIGRIRDGKVFMSGTGTGSTFPKLVEDVKPPAPIHIDLAEKAGYGSSDHTSFTTKNVPVLFFFSGLHGDYHKPSDTVDKIDSAEAAKLLDYIADLITHLENDPRPQFLRVAEPSPGPVGSGGGSGYGPAFGSIPDFNEPPKGVRFADVRDGTPAAKAGLKAGDILIEFDGKEISNLYDFTYALRAHKPGDLVLVKVIRADKTIEAKVLLTERR